MLKGTGSVIGLTHDPESHIKWSLYGPILNHLITEFEDDSGKENEHEDLGTRGQDCNISRNDSHVDDVFCVMGKSRFPAEPLCHALRSTSSCDCASCDSASCNSASCDSASCDSGSCDSASCDCASCDVHHQNKGAHDHARGIRTVSCWSVGLRFKRFRLAEKLHKEKGNIQVSSLLCAMGYKSETIFNTFALTDIEQNDFDNFTSNVYTDREDQLTAGLGLTYNVIMKLMSPRYLLRQHNYMTIFTPHCIGARCM